MEKNKILLASDHRGIGVRELISDYLLSAPEYEVSMINDEFPENVDYPDIAAAVAAAVSKQQVWRGILICGTGIGMSVVANKFPGIRAAVCHNVAIAELSRRHNDSNILCLSGDLLDERSSTAIVAVWLAVPFEYGRHSQRIDKIRAIEQKNYTSVSAVIPQRRF